MFLMPAGNVGLPDHDLRVDTRRQALQSLLVTVTAMTTPLQPFRGLPFIEAAGTRTGTATTDPAALSGAAPGGRVVSSANATSTSSSLPTCQGAGVLVARVSRASSARRTRSRRRSTARAPVGVVRARCAYRMP